MSKSVKQKDRMRKNWEMTWTGEIRDLYSEQTNKFNEVDRILRLHEANLGLKKETFLQNIRATKQ